jgi:hypothetical protein
MCLAVTSPHFRTRNGLIRKGLHKGQKRKEKSQVLWFPVGCSLLLKSRSFFLSPWTGGKGLIWDLWAFLWGHFKVRKLTDKQGCLHQRIQLYCASTWPALTPTQSRCLSCKEEHKGLLSW